MKKSCIDQRGTIKPKSIHLIKDKDVKRDSLSLQELVHVRSEPQQLLKSVTEWDKDCQIRLSMEISVFAIVIQICTVFAAAQLPLTIAIA